MRKANYTEVELELVKANYESMGARIFCEKFSMDKGRLKNIIEFYRKQGIRFKLKEGLLGKILGAKDYSNQTNLKASDFIIPTPQSAYILGYLWADGYLTESFKDGKRTSRLIAIECVTEDLSDVAQMFGGWTKSTRQRVGRKNQTTFKTSCGEYVEFLKSMDYKIKSAVSPYKIINYLKNSDERLVAYFIRGLFDGDGCAYIHEGNNTYQMSIAASYDYDWGAVRDVLDDFSLYYNITQRVQGKNRSSVCKMCGKKWFKKFFDYIYPTGYDFGLKRKYDKLKIGAELYDKMPIWHK